MRFLYHFRTRGTGAEAVHIAGIANALEALGHEVVFSSPTGVDPRKTAGANPYREAGRSLIARLSRKLPGFFFELLEVGYNFAAYARNARILRERKCDVIYERHAFFLASTALLAKRRALPLIVEVNELVGDERVRKQPLFNNLATLCDRLVFNRASVIVVVSPYLRRRIEAHGIAPEKILVLPNAVAREDFEIVADGAAVRARLPADVFVVGFVGWLVEWHRLDFLLDVLASLTKTHPQLTLMLVGDGTLRDDLSARATQLGVRVVFTGTVPHREIPGCIAAMDVCIVPHSNAYRSPIKLFEYMGQARPVIAPRTEPIAMVIEHGRNGLLFEPLSSDDLRAQLSAIIADAALRKRLGDAARRDVLEKHTWERNAEAVLQKLRQSESP